MTDAPGDHATGGGDPSAVPDLRVRHRLELEFGSREEWDDPKLEWRRLFSELLGTFFLVLVAAGGGILVGEGQISLAAAVVAPGLMVMAIILFMGAISGAHLNPAVSLAFALRGDFPWKRVPGYIIVQLVGATLACLFLLAVFGNIQHLGATLPGSGYEDWQALLMEIALTARPGQRHPRHRLGGPERRRDRRARRRRLHRAGGALGGAGQRHLDEPGALVRTRRSSAATSPATGSTSSGPLAGALIAVGCAYVLRGRGRRPDRQRRGLGRADAGEPGREAASAGDIDRGRGRAARHRRAREPKE